MKVFTSTSLACLLLITISRSSDGSSECDANDASAKKTANAISNFTLQLYRAISDAEPTKNIIVSPVSIVLALSLLEAGSSGTTRAQINRQLLNGAESDSETGKMYQSLQRLLTRRQAEGIELAIANGIYHYQETALKEAYLDKVKCFLNTNMEKCNFAQESDGCRRRINAWISNQTRAKIPELFKEGSIHQLTRLVLSNAIYFKASWEQQCSYLPEMSPFYKFGRNESQSVRFFTSEHKYYYDDAGLAFTLGIPYKGDQFRMYIVLPKKRDGLPELESELNATALLDLANRAKLQQVSFTIPLFKVRSSLDLKPILDSIGIRDMFTSAANFSGMTSDRLKVDAAVHEAFITVNENGTEAAAATGFGISAFSLPPPPKLFVADHPFMYAVVHMPSRAIMFAGKVLQVEQ